jgi:hypothetical protein
MVAEDDDGEEHGMTDLLDDALRCLMLSTMYDFGLDLQNAVVMPFDILNDDRSSQALVWTFFVTSDLRYMISEGDLSACPSKKEMEDWMEALSYGESHTQVVIVIVINRRPEEWTHSA